jgi:hypothetical protein
LWILGHYLAIDRFICIFLTQLTKHHNFCRFTQRLLPRFGVNEGTEEAAIVPLELDDTEPEEIAPVLGHRVQQLIAIRTGGGKKTTISGD